MGYILKSDLAQFTDKQSTVISDWTALKQSTGVSSVRAGCDLEMPGPAKWRGRLVAEAVENGDISRADVKRAAANVLKLVHRTKGLGNATSEAPERSNDNPQLRRAIREAGAEGIVLLKNDNAVLPIKNCRKIAVIGPNAQRCIAGGGGSAAASAPPTPETSE